MNFKNSRGITLIALAITIGVLIIISFISIASLTSDNGIIKQTNVAKVEKLEGDVREQVGVGVTAINLAILEARGRDNSYNPTNNAGAIQAKLKEILNQDKTGLNGEFDFGGNEVTGAATEITIGYTGDDYQNACNDANAKIVFTIEVGQRAIEIRDEINSSLKDQNQDDVTININPTILANYAQIGEYVNYDPTTGGNVNSSNTTYTSVPGSTESHGNGYIALADGQTFSATAYKNSGGKWRIFDIADGKITLISDPIYRDNTDGTAMLSASSTNGLYLNNGIGYLWAEEELHRIAAIYGHGAGADLSQTVTYYYGGPNDQNGSISEIDNNNDGVIDNLVELQQGRKATLNLDTPSGARALTLDDIHKVSGQDYGVNSSLRTDAKTANNAKYYPTLETPNTDSGKSELDNSPSGNYYYTYYSYSISSSSSSDSIDKANQKSMLRLGKNYWVATRSLYIASATNVMFLTNFINASNVVAGEPMCSTINFPGGTCNNSVRVLVTLAAGTQTDSKEYNSATGWNIN